MTRRLITLIVLAGLLGAIAGLHACSSKMTEKARDGRACAHLRARFGRRAEPSGNQLESMSAAR